MENPRRCDGATTDRAARCGFACDCQPFQGVRIHVRWFWTRRREEREARELIRDRERLASLSRGGSSTRPIQVTSPAVIEPRVLKMPCPLCAGFIRIVDHEAPMSRMRRVRVRCQQCSIPRELWFKLVSNDAN